MASFSFSGSYNKVTVTGDEIIIDGKVVESFDNLKHKNISIIINGNVCCLNAEGSVQCENVEGGIDAGGSVNCGNVNGNIDAGGSVHCGKVSGYVDAGGSIHMSR